MLTAAEYAFLAFAALALLWAVVQVGPTLMPGYEFCGGAE